MYSILNESFYEIIHNNQMVHSLRMPCVECSFLDYSPSQQITKTNLNMLENTVKKIKNETLKCKKNIIYTVLFKSNSGQK